LSFGQHAVIIHVLAVFGPDLIGAKHHHDRHERQSVNRIALQERQNSLATIHLINRGGEGKDCF